MQCEGRRRYGGAFSFGPPVWKQCENEAIVMLTVKQEKVDTLPACLKCWNEAVEKGIHIMDVKPLPEKAKNKKAE